MEGICLNSLEKVELRPPRVERGTYGLEVRCKGFRDDGFRKPLYVKPSKKHGLEKPTEVAKSRVLWKPNGILSKVVG
jgi:hypothetical protein